MSDPRDTVANTQWAREQEEVTVMDRTADGKVRYCETGLEDLQGKQNKAIAKGIIKSYERKEKGHEDE